MSGTPRILVVGGGYAGFYAAWHLEKRLKRSEASVTILDPRPYMTYQPFLPEVAAGSIEARHAAVSLRRHLRRTTVLAVVALARLQPLPLPGQHRVVHDRDGVADDPLDRGRAGGQPPPLLAVPEAGVCAHEGCCRQPVVVVVVDDDPGPRSSGDPGAGHRDRPVTDAAQRSPFRDDRGRRERIFPA